MPPRPSSAIMRYHPPSNVLGTNRPSSAKDEVDVGCRETTSTVSTDEGSDWRSIARLYAIGGCVSVGYGRRAAAPLAHSARLGPGRAGRSHKATDRPRVS